METAYFSHGLVTRAQEQVVGVGEDQLGAKSLELIGGKSFDGALGAHRRKHRCGYVAVRRSEQTRPGASIDGLQFEFEHGYSPQNQCKPSRVMTMESRVSGAPSRR